MRKEFVKKRHHFRIKFYEPAGERRDGVEASVGGRMRLMCVGLQFSHAPESAFRRLFAQHEEKLIFPATSTDSNRRFSGLAA